MNRYCVTDGWIVEHPHPNAICVQVQETLTSPPPPHPKTQILCSIDHMCTCKERDHPNAHPNVHERPRPSKGLRFVAGACCYWWSLQGGKLEGIIGPIESFQKAWRWNFSITFQSFHCRRTAYPTSISVHIYASEHFVPGGRCGVGNGKEVEFETGRCLSAWTSSFQAQVTRVCLKTHLSYFHLSIFHAKFDFCKRLWCLEFHGICHFEDEEYVTFHCRSRRYPREFDGQVLLELPSHHGRWAMKRQLKWQFALANANRRVCMPPFGQDVKRVELELLQLDFNIYCCRFDSRIAN